MTSTSILPSGIELALTPELLGEQETIDYAIDGSTESAPAHALVDAFALVHDGAESGRVIGWRSSWRDAIM